MKNDPSRRTHFTAIDVLALQVKQLMRRPAPPQVPQASASEPSTLNGRYVNPCPKRRKPK